MKKSFKIGEHLAKLQARTWLNHALSSSSAVWWLGAPSARDNHLLACNFAKKFTILIFY